ncbi:MAG: hypothetical protein ACLU9S_04875 [Oscillospiraceae bacterium]
MEQEKQKQDHTEDALKLPADFREEQYLHTVASEKRHELLMETPTACRSRYFARWSI